MDAGAMSAKPTRDLPGAQTHLHQAAQAASLLNREGLYLIPMATPDIAGVALGLWIYGSATRLLFQHNLSNVVRRVYSDAPEVALGRQRTVYCLDRRYDLRKDAIRRLSYEIEFYDGNPNAWR